MKTIIEWMKKPAKAWQFWLPQSGLNGGTVFGVIVFLIVLLLSGCACQNARNVRACEVTKRVLITTVLISASAALYESCDRDRRHGRDVHLPYSPDCNTGECR